MSNMNDKEKLKAITKYINKIIEKDEEVDIYNLFDIKDIIDDEEDNENNYKRYIEPYIRGELYDLSEILKGDNNGQN